MNKLATSKCRVCKAVRVKVGAGRRPDKPVTIYVDQKGRRWNGRACPQCKFTAVKRAREEKAAVMEGFTLKECRQCGVRKPHKRDGKTGRNWRFIDRTGGLWGGRLCPQCKNACDVLRVAERKVEQPAPAPELVGPSKPLFAVRLRACQRCGLKTHNYYLCPPCHASKTGHHYDIASMYG